MTLTVGLTMAALMLVLLVLGVPICIAIALSSLIAGAGALDFNMMLQTGSQRTFTGISVFTLIAIPFFILAGNIMNSGGIAMRLMNFARLLVGKLPGSYAHTNCMANMMFGAISGSGVAAASAMGSIIGPIAEKQGYSKDYMATVNIATAPTGLLIPPSNVLITYSLVSGGTSVAALFLAGYIPGILWGLSCMVVAFFYAKKLGYEGDKQKITAALALKVTLDAIPSLFLIVVVIAGIITGAFTATEGAVVAVVYSLILSVIYRSITWKQLKQIYADSALMTGIIVLLIGVSSIMSWVISFVNIPAAVGDMLNAISTNKYIILLIINIFLLFVGVKVAQTTIERVFKPLLPYYVVIIAVLMLCTYFPSISSWLPELAGYQATLG